MLLFFIGAALSPAALSEWICSLMREEAPETLLVRFPDTNERGATPARVPTGSDERREWLYEPDRFRVELEYREQVDYPVRLHFLLRVESRNAARWKTFDTGDDAADWLNPLGPVTREGSSVLAVREEASSKTTRAAFFVEVDLERQSVLVDWPNKWLAVHPNPLYRREFGPDFGRRFCMDPEPRR